MTFKKDAYLVFAKKGYSIREMPSNEDWFNAGFEACEKLINCPVEKRTAPEIIKENYDRFSPIESSGTDIPDVL